MMMTMMKTELMRRREMMEQMIDMMFNMSDNDGDGFLSADELNEMFEAMDEDDHEGHADAYAILHIEEEGDYGVGLPSEIEFEIVALSEGEHDHGDHDDHDDHDDHETMTTTVMTMEMIMTTTG